MTRIVCTSDLHEHLVLPARTHIVLAQGPPARLRRPTSAEGGHARVGSTAMTAALERVRPRLMVCGHIHPSHGRDRLGDTEIVSAALVANRNEPVKPGRPYRPVIRPPLLYWPFPPAPTANCAG